MAKETVLAKVKTGEPGLLKCLGARPGDVIAQAMALSNGDNVSGVFAPVIPGNDLIVQVRPGPDIDCLLLLHRYVADV